MIVPLITLLKLIALGSIKLIFLLLGIAFFPIYALRLILGGATGMLLPALTWLVDNERLDANRHKAIVSDLEELGHIELTRFEARQVLWKLVKKMIANLINTVVGWGTWINKQLRKIIG